VDWTVSVDGKKYKEVGLGSNTYINITSDLKELSKGEPIHYFLLRYSQDNCHNFIVIDGLEQHLQRAKVPLLGSMHRYARVICNKLNNSAVI
jgi:hypothetical protein